MHNAFTRTVFSTTKFRKTPHRLVFIVRFFQSDVGNISPENLHCRYDNTFEEYRFLYLAIAPTIQPDTSMNINEIQLFKQFTASALRWTLLKRVTDLE